MKNNTLQEVAAFLKEQTTLTLFCHQRPDGDTLGSAFGLKHCLEAMGKQVQILCPDPVSPRYRFLSDGVEWLKGEPEGALVFIDIASPEMAGDLREWADRADLVIDHHPTNPCYGKMNYVDPQAGATGEIMVELAGLLGGLTSKAAEAFYTAIATDTGCFKYGNTTARTHLMAAETVRCGFDLKATNKWLFQTKSKAEMELNRLAMENLEYWEEGRIVTMLISAEMLRETGAGADELETISALPAQLAGVKAAATFKETTPGTYKVSLRTDGSVHGGEICAGFGGGGHCQAAGCTMVGEYPALKNQMVDALKEVL